MNWNSIAMILITASAGVAAPVYGQAATDAGSGGEKAQTDAVQAIRRALESNEASPGELRRAAEQVRRATRQNQLVQSVLGDALAPSASQESLRTALGEAAAILSFEPVDEAPLPEGFPALTPVGEIRVNDYPSYRLARTATAPNNNIAFWRLFRHIQSREIAMTAPVEMTYAADDGEPRETEMAFLYRRVEQGPIGRDGKIDVADVPAQRAVSIGWRGDSNAKNVGRAKLLLDAWLEEHANEYRAAGKLRVMGYNSPFVPVSKRYFEVQIPVAATMPR